MRSKNKNIEKMSKNSSVTYPAVWRYGCECGECASLNFGIRDTIRRKTKMSIEIAARFWVWVRLIDERSTNTQRISTHTCACTQSHPLSPKTSLQYLSIF
jgi:hypothetical protein